MKLIIKNKLYLLQLEIKNKESFLKKENDKKVDQTELVKSLLLVL